MKTEWEDFRKSFEKQIKPALKALAFDKGWQIREQLTTHLEAAWECEDDLLDAVEDAVEEGISGKKPEDFMPHAAFKKARGDWDKAIKAHKEQIKALESWCDKAGKLHKDLRKLLDPVQKDIKKTKPSRADMKDFAKTLHEAEAALRDLEMGSQIYGTLKVPERFYGLKEDATIAALIAKKAKKAGGKELPKILEEGQGKKNVKIARSMAEKVIDLCDAAVEQKDSDPKKAEKTLKNADKQMTALGKLASGYQEAAKKQAKEIEKAANAKDLKAMIEDIVDFMGSAREHFDWAQKEMKKKQPA